VISNTEDYIDHLPLLTLGCFPDNRGKHYVNISVQKERLSCLLAVYVKADSIAGNNDEEDEYNEPVLFYDTQDD